MSKFQCRWCGDLFKYPGIMRHSITCWNRAATEAELHAIRIANEKHPYGLDMYLEREAVKTDPPLSFSVELARKFSKAELKEILYGTRESGMKDMRTALEIEARKQYEAPK
jgi:hypothetical protein